MIAPVFTDEEDEELKSLRRFPEIGREELLLRTNIGSTATLDDAVAAPQPDRADQRADDHPRSSVSDTRPSMHQRDK